jgi:hypothetical protein
MRILLDACLPARLGRELVGHDATKAPKMGWAGLKNGALLTRAVTAGFDVFLTVDKNLPKLQKLAAYAIAVVGSCCGVRPTISTISRSGCRSCQGGGRAGFGDPALQRSAGERRPYIQTRRVRDNAPYLRAG